MLRVNDTAFLSSFKDTMTYDECREAFLNAGYGAIPVGEYLLMLGIAAGSAKSGIPKELLLVALYQQKFPTPELSKGLGDTIAKITHATGLDKLAELYTQLTGKDCGCKNRQEALNKLVPYGITETSNGDSV
jgi:hypothetical protein